MYTASTFRLAQVMDVPLLLVIPRASFVIALGAWALTLTGLAIRLVRGFGR
jgi:hypothetical protein